MASSSSVIKVTVVGGSDLIAKNRGGNSSPYAEVIIFDDQGERVSSAQVTKHIKDNLNPRWNQCLEFTCKKPIRETFTLQVRVWDKHLLRKDKFMGQFTLMLNHALVQDSSVLEAFPLAGRKASEKVKGTVQLKIECDSLKSSGAAAKSVRAQLESSGDHAVKDAAVPKNSSELKKSLIVSGMQFMVLEQEEDDDFEKIRYGPPASSFVALPGSKAKVTSGGLNVAHSGSDYGFQGAVGDTAVSDGLWFYEVTLGAAGQAQIGWCTQGFDGSSNGDSWTYDGSRQQRLRNGNGEQFGQRWGARDVIGVAIDMSERQVRFFRNGHDMGPTWGAGESPKMGSRITPFLNLSRNQSTIVNFGKLPFKYPQARYNPLHSFLSKKEEQELNALFSHYLEKSKDSIMEMDDCAEEDLEDLDAICEGGVDAYNNDLGITDDMDPSFLIIAWKLGCQTAWEISRDEWMHGWSVAGCKNIKQMKAKVGEWKESLKNTAIYPLFYESCFDYMKGDKRILDYEQTKILWTIVLSKHKPWKLLPKWFEFLESVNTRAINNDLWSTLLPFLEQYPNDFSSYDIMDSAWPVAIDDFVEYVQGKSNEDDSDDSSD